MDKRSATTAVEPHQKIHTIESETDPQQSDVYMQRIDKSASTIVSTPQDPKNLPMYLSVLLYIGIILAMFCVSLNTTVVAPAMNIIATDLKAPDQQTWVATAYLLTFNAIQPIAGKFSDIFGRKPLLLFGLLMFFVGSLINSLARTMPTLIAGRTVQGLGGGSIMSMAFIIVTDLAPPHLRPRFQSLLTVMYGLASCAGILLGNFILTPLFYFIGGTFVDHVSWHWDFWLNVILSGISFVLIFFLLKEPLKLESSSFFAKIKRIDWLGTLFSLAFVCCLLLGLNWGPLYGWNDPHTIGSFCGAGVALILLVIVEGWIAKEPLMPARVLTNPDVVILYLYMVCLGLGFIGTLYFGPVMYQSVFGAESMTSGIRLIPYMVCLVVASISSGYLLSFFPYIKFYLVLGASINVLGFGLFYTVNESSNWGQQAGFLTLCGLCFGLSQSNVILAVQSSSERKDMAVATGLNNFFLILASSVGVAIYQALFQLFLAAQYLQVDSAILATANEYGALKNYLYIRRMPVEAQKPIIHAYYQALHTMFIIPLVASGLGLICALFVKNIKYQPHPVPAPSAIPVTDLETKEDADLEKQNA